MELPVRPERMNRSAYVYVALTTVAAFALAAVLPWDQVVNLAWADLVGLASFIAVAILSEAMAIDFAVGANRAAKSSIAFLPLFAAAALFPPIAALFAAAAVHAFAELVLKDRVLWRTLFNVSQSAIGIGAAAWIYNLLAPSNDNALAFAGAFGALALTAATLNLVIVSGFFAVRQQTAFFGVLRRVIGPGAGNLLYDLLACPVAMVAVLLYQEFHVGGLLMIILPLLLIRYSYLSKVQLQQANRDLLSVLVKAIETRDPYTSGHSVRVSTLARAIADDLGLSRRMAERVEWAALLHDIGKIDMMYAPIIRKPSDLTEEERRIIRSHATKGAELLRTLSSVDDVVIQGVKYHHERFDGSGYPDGLVGKAIPVAARIIMLCDSIDAMLSDRPYRRALTIEQARVELLRCAGSQFDPDIVEVVLRRNTLERAASLTDRGAAAREQAPIENQRSAHLA